jgi:hypothetical protein
LSIGEGQRVITQADQIDHPHLRGLYEYWDGCRQGRAMPARSDLDVIDMKPWIQMLHLIGVEQPGRRYRLRVFAAAVAQVLGRDFTGAFIDEIDYPALTDVALAGCDAVCEARQPVIQRVWLDGTPPDKAFERMGLPLSADGDIVDMILVAVGGMAMGSDAGPYGFRPEDLMYYERLFRTAFS